MTTIYHKMSKSDAASDDGIIELLTRIIRSRIGSLIVFCLHLLTRGLGYGQGLSLGLDSIMLGGLLQVWYDEASAIRNV